MADSSLAKKLLLKPEHRTVVLNAPAGYLEQHGIEAAEKLGKEAAGSMDFVQVFVKNAQELNGLMPAVQKALKNDGLLWICYPKGGSKIKTDLNRDILWEDMEGFGLAGVAMVSVDNVWSAMRFRPLDKVGK